ncbi:hypothetical protein [Ralstonia sp.]|uniref:hypothetical protein n=1 Tax=Ralstonia sp. TaxID=54061 RepID=UPI002CDE8724|nr:hypothetical protein [Ralstonia sp.]HWV04821.1 hypothetical protein [Ralstonia sp.]
MTSLLKAASNMYPSADTPNLLSTESPLAPLLSTLTGNGDTSAGPSRLHQWSQWIALSSLALCGLSLWVYVQWKIAALAWVVGATLVVGVVAAAVFVLVGVKATWAEMRDFEGSFITSVSSRLVERRTLVLRIGSGFSPQDILFARDYLKSVAAQLRSRISLIVGAIDKVGVLPLAASAAITLLKLNEAGAVTVVWGAGTVALAYFYMLSVHMLDAAYTVERYVVILDHAAIHATQRTGTTQAG